jgi:hypothetical protein
MHRIYLLLLRRISKTILALGVAAWRPPVDRHEMHRAPSFTARSVLDQNSVVMNTTPHKYDRPLSISFQCERPCLLGKVDLATCLENNFLELIPNALNIKFILRVSPAAFGGNLPFARIIEQRADRLR